MITEISAAAEQVEKTRIAKISAMRAERDNAFMLAEGILRRAGIKVEQAKSVREIDKLFASPAPAHQITSTG